MITLNTKRRKTTKHVKGDYFHQVTPKHEYSEN